MVGPFPDVGNPRTGVGTGKVGSGLQGQCPSQVEVSSRQSDVWDWSSCERAGPEMPVGGPEVKSGLMCGSRRASLGGMCSRRVGPGTEPRGTPTPKAWAEEEEKSQERQCCDGRGVAVGGESAGEAVGRPEAAIRFNTAEPKKFLQPDTRGVLGFLV